MKFYFKLCAILIIAIYCFFACSNNEGFKLVPDEAKRKVDVLYNGQLFTSYIYPTDLEKPVLNPICTAKGTIITRGFPLAPRPNERVDHPHHIGAWFNFGDVNGLDFWNNSYAIPADKKSEYGAIRHRNIVSMQDGASQGILIVETDWVDHAQKVLLREETKFVFSAEGNRRMIDRTTKLTAQRDTVVFTDNKEGLIALRMDRAFEEPSNQPELYLDTNGNPTEVKVMNNEGVNGVYRNSEGLEKGNVWGKPTKWVSLSADKNGEKISIAIIDHKNNPGYPAHSHARGYGLFSTNNMGSQAFDKKNPLFKLTLNPGQSITFRHRIVVKTGGFITDEEMNRLFSDFNK